MQVSVQDVFPEQVAFLLGAGFSRSAKLPSLMEIMEKFEKWLEKLKNECEKIEVVEREDDEHFRQFYDDNTKPIPEKDHEIESRVFYSIYYFFKRISIAEDDLVNKSKIEIKSYNIEKIMSSMEDVLSPIESDTSKFYTSYNRNLQEVMKGERNNVRLSLLILRAFVEDSISTGPKRISSLKFKDKEFIDIENLKKRQESLERISGTNEQTSSLNDLNAKLDGIHNRLQGEINKGIFDSNSSSTSYIDVFESFLKEVSQEILPLDGEEAKRKRKPISIFTLNQDSLLEDKIFTKDKVKDNVYYYGIADKTEDEKENERRASGKKNVNPQEFRIEGFDNYTENRIANYYKLHGSFSWWTKDIDFNFAHDKKFVIFGTSRKFKSQDPYFSMYNSFWTKLKEPETKILIIIGYSFNDDHINDAIKNGLKKNNNLKILIVSPDIIDTYRYLIPKDINNNITGSNGNIVTKYRDVYEKYIELKYFDKEFYDINSYSTYLYQYFRNFEEDAIVVQKFLHAAKDEISNERRGYDNKIGEINQIPIPIKLFYLNEQFKYIGDKSYFIHINDIRKELGVNILNELEIFIEKEFNIIYENILFILYEIREKLEEESKNSTSEKEKNSELIIFFDGIFQEIRTSAIILRQFIPNVIKILTYELSLQNNGLYAKDLVLKTLIKLTYYFDFVSIDIKPCFTNEPISGNTNRLMDLLKDRGEIYRKYYAKANVDPQNDWEHLISNIEKTYKNNKYINPVAESSSNENSVLGDSVNICISEKINELYIDGNLREDVMKDEDSKKLYLLILKGIYELNKKLDVYEERILNISALILAITKEINKTSVYSNVLGNEYITKINNNVMIKLHKRKAMIFRLYHDEGVETSLFRIVKYYSKKFTGDIIVKHSFLREIHSQTHRHNIDKEIDVYENFINYFLSKINRMNKDHPAILGIDELFREVIGLYDGSDLELRNEFITKWGLNIKKYFDDVVGAVDKFKLFFNNQSSTIKNHLIETNRIISKLSDSQGPLGDKYRNNIKIKDRKDKEEERDNIMDDHKFTFEHSSRIIFLHATADTFCTKYLRARTIDMINNYQYVKVSKRPDSILEDDLWDILKVFFN